LKTKERSQLGKEDLPIAKNLTLTYIRPYRQSKDLVPEQPNTLDDMSFDKMSCDEMSFYFRGQWISPLEVGSRQQRPEQAR
jgi:hypothetical protein